MSLKFSKMHGLGNDFMVIDGINQVFTPNSAHIAAWANRHFGIGFDQLLLVERAQTADADFRYRIFNADGGEVQQCGNGARCFAKFVYDKGLTDKTQIAVETAAGIIKPQIQPNGLVTVDMGAPRFLPEEIPFRLPNDGSETAGALTHQIVWDNRQPAIAASLVSMGNPHAVLRVDDTETAPVAEIGAALQQHPQFPERVNVGFMQVLSPTHIALRVFERGVGETLACGTGACAAVVAGMRQGWLAAGETVQVSLRGGDLFVQWHSGSHVMMTGEAVWVFDGELAA